MSESRSSPEQILCFVIAWYLLFLTRKKAETRLLSPHFSYIVCWQTAVFRSRGVIIPCQDPGGSAVAWEEGGLVVFIYGTVWEKVSVTQKAAMVRDRRRAGRTWGCQSFSATSAVPSTSLGTWSKTENAMASSHFTNSVPDHPSFCFSTIHSLYPNHPINAWTSGWSLSGFSCCLLRMNAGQLGLVLNSWQQSRAMHLIYIANDLDSPDLIYSLVLLTLLGDY